LKPETRGYLESALDKILAGELLPAVQWLEEDMPVKSMKDLCIGYIVGAILGIAHIAILFGEGRFSSAEEDVEVRAMIKRRLPEIGTKIEEELNR